MHRKGLRFLTPLLAALLSILPASHTFALSLHDVVSHTLHTNPALSAKRDSWLAAEHAYRAAKGEFLPSIDAVAGQGYEHTNNPTLRAAGLSATEMHRQENAIVLDQPLFMGGRLLHHLDAQDFYRRAARFEYQAAAQITALRAIRAYLNVLLAHRLLQLAQFNLDNHLNILKKVRIKFNADATHRANLELASSKTFLARSTLINARKRVKNAVAEFVSVTGMQPKQLSNTISIAHFPIHTAQQAHQETLSNNPYILSKRADALAAKANVHVAKSHFLPSVNLEVSSSYNSNIDGLRGNFEEHTAMVFVRYNLFHGGSDLARVRETAEQHVAAADTLSQTIRDTQQTTQEEWNAITNNKPRLVQLANFSNESQKLLASYKAQFSVGRQTLFNVLNASSQLYLARVNYTNLYFENIINQFTLLANIGTLTQRMAHHYDKH